MPRVGRVLRRSTRLRRLFGDGGESGCHLFVGALALDADCALIVHLAKNTEKRAEIVAITLGIVAEAPLLNQVLVLSGIALVVTVGVYGLVGVIVKIDDLGYWLAEKSSALM